MQYPQARYITLSTLAPWLNTWKDHPEFKIDYIGQSVLKTKIPALTIGHGSIKILAWSQMHGNESSTTKMLIGVCQWLFNGHTNETKHILERCTLVLIPILNPDGAAAYTRENANQVDLNRDAITLSQPESTALRTVYDQFKPHLCLNLHGQRSIYGLEGSNAPAVISFLSPSSNKEKTIDSAREQAMALIVGMHMLLNQHIPGKIGRYDDTYNANCVGDTFQNLGTPTILFEAGQLDTDYKRNNTTELLIMAFKALLLHLTNTQPFIPVKDVVSAYNRIPENQVNYCDIVLKNVYLNMDNQNIDIAIQFKEELMVDHCIGFKAQLIDWGKLVSKLGHQTIDFHNKTLPVTPSKGVNLDDFIAEYVLNNFSR